jgi:hypothetical protein
MIYWIVVITITLLGIAFVVWRSLSRDSHFLLTLYAVFLGLLLAMLIMKASRFIF